MLLINTALKAILSLTKLGFSVSFYAEAYSNEPPTCPTASYNDRQTYLVGVFGIPLNWCSAPLSNGVRSARITLRRYLESGPFVDVRVYQTGAAFCSSLALTVMVEVRYQDRPVVLQECSLQRTGQQSGHRYCPYRCVCAGPCNQLHLQFQSLKAINIDNTAWEYCGVQICEP